MTGSHAGSVTIKRRQLGSRLSMAATTDAATGSGSGADVLGSLTRREQQRTPAVFPWRTAADVVSPASQIPGGENGY